MEKFYNLSKMLSQLLIFVSNDENLQNVLRSKLSFLMKCQLIKQEAVLTNH